MASFDENFNIDELGNDDRACGAMVLAMAYVPDQIWGDLYDEGVALQRGTLFPDLDKPFTGRKQARNG